MNACELPCGSVLKVQPADSEFKKKNMLAEVQCHGYGQSSNLNKKIKPTSIPMVDVIPVAEEVSEDLDDFFASLA